MSADRLVIVLMQLSIGVSFGAVFTINKFAAKAGIPPIGYAFWEALLAGLVLLAVILATGRRLPIERRFLTTSLVTGLFGFAIPIAVFNTVAGHLPAGVATLVQALSPPFTYLLAFVIRVERFRWLSAAGILFGAAGIVVIVVPEFSLPSPDMAPWLLLGILSPASLAVVNIYVAVSHSADVPPITRACGLFLGGAAILLPVTLATGSWYGWSGGLAESDWTILSASLIFAFVNVLFLEIIRRAGPVFFSQQGYFSVISGMLWGMAILGEHHSAWIWLALALLFAGLALVNAGTSRNPSFTAGRGETGPA